ncbi:MAG: hypothetical protein JJT95_08125 [Pararhodobacter sp.]|nr:hypothetical protein [Pararhodobacter sp.]
MAAIGRIFRRIAHVVASGSPTRVVRRTDAGPEAAALALTFTPIGHFFHQAGDVDSRRGWRASIDRRVPARHGGGVIRAVARVSTGTAFAIGAAMWLRRGRDAGVRVFSGGGGRCKTVVGKRPCRRQHRSGLRAAR